MTEGQHERLLVLPVVYPETQRSRIIASAPQTLDEMPEREQQQPHKDANSSSDGQFKRKPSAFRNFISRAPDAEFPAEACRYALYMNYGCPWAHRTVLVRALKGLEGIIELIATDFELTQDDGWKFTGKNGSLARDPLYGFTGLKQLYLKADPEYTGRYLVPCLWDKKRETIVNNESSEIIRMLYTEFDHLVSPEDLRESSRPQGGFYPVHLRDEIDVMNEWVYETVNNGVYKCGFATSQAAYDANVYPLFRSLDRLEAHMAPGNPANHGGPYMFGPHLTEADIRLYTTLIRFDVAYHTIFMCNLKTIRGDYKNLYRWLRLCYWRGGAEFSTADKDRTYVFKDTSNFAAYKIGYMRAKQRMVNKGDDSIEVVVPAGPAVNIDPLDFEDVEEDNVSVGAIAARIEGLKIGEGKRDTTAAIFAANQGVRDGNAQDQTESVTRETHGDENEKWYKAAKEVEKAAKGPNLHLAL